MLLATSAVLSSGGHGMRMCNGGGSCHERWVDCCGNRKCGLVGSWYGVLGYKQRPRQAVSDSLRAEEMPGSGQDYVDAQEQ